MKPIPSAWGQAYPRAVALAPEGLFVPAATLRHLLTRGTDLHLIYSGFGMEPSIQNGQTVRVRAGRGAVKGDLVLCECGRWGDLRRLLSWRRDGTVVTALDACPGGRETIPDAAILGVVEGGPGARGRLGRLPAWAFPLWSAGAALLHWWRLITAAPVFGDRASDSVREKYAHQVDEYTSMLSFPPDQDLLALLRALRPGAGEVLVAGCGAGGEALHLARAGFRVTGVDFSKEMIDAARVNARQAGLPIDFQQADVAGLDLPGRRFDAIYLTPLVYSFIPGRARRVETLRTLRRHMSAEGCVVFSAALYRSRRERLQAALAWRLRRRAAPDIEPGDWYTRFLTPRGSLGTSFLHLFRAREVERESRDAGFDVVDRMGRAHFVAYDAPSSASIAGQKSASLRK